ncbi:MAG: hypothetical protein PHG03_05360 [Bacilli bacterium]|nr:hypothetical protein [Bacilli bacterium]MDD4795962.1 hypothetical protein [Bacilli bacterium]
MSGLDLSFENITISLIVTILAYMIFPTTLRLTSINAYEKKDANKIAIINSIIVAIIFYVLRDMVGGVKNNTLSVAPAVFYYYINLGLLQGKFKPKNFTYLFMVLSLASAISSWYTTALLFGPVSFILAYGGLRITRVKSWQRITFYIEAFLGLFIFCSYLYSITLNAGSFYIWGFVWSLIAITFFHFIFFKNNSLDANAKNEEDKNETNKEVTTVYCKKCGGKLDSNKVCGKCGKKYFKFDYKILSVILSIIIIGLISGGIYLYLLYNKATLLYADHLANDLIKNNHIFNELKLLNNGRTTQWTKQKLNFFDENIAFVVEGYEKYYFTYDCMVDSIYSEYSYWAYNKEQAISRGYIKGSCN